MYKLVEYLIDNKNEPQNRDPFFMAEHVGLEHLIWANKRGGEPYTLKL